METGMLLPDGAAATWVELFTTDKPSDRYTQRGCSLVCSLALTSSPG